MSPALILALLILTVLGLAALVIALFRAAARGKREPPFWPVAAERLDPGAPAADLPDGDGTLAGRYRGFEIVVVRETPSRERHRVTARLGLAPPLGLGLALGSEPGSREPAPEGASPFATGIPALDRALEPRARDPRGARRLFERKPLRDRLEAALRRWSLVALTDEALTLGAEHSRVEPAPLDDLLADAAAIARLIDEDRSRLKGG